MVASAGRMLGEAFWTLKAFRQEVQTYSRLTEEPSWMRIFCKFGFQRRLVARREWLRALPKFGPLLQE